MSYYFFVDIFTELTDKITQFVTNVSKLFYIFFYYSVLYLRRKFHGNIPNSCQDIANLPLGILIWVHRVNVNVLTCVFH